MRKLAICCLVIVAAAMFAPAAQAQKTFCYHLTYFCDGVQVTQYSVGGNTGSFVVGLWDWVCLDAGTGSLIAGVPNKFGGQPIYPYSGGTGSGFAALFAFKPLTAKFDLWGSFDGQTIFAFQSNSPYTRTKGPCNPLVRSNSTRPAVLR